MGSGQSLAVNGVIATNLVLGHALAWITSSDVTTTGDVSVSSSNTSVIEATTKSVTTTGDTAVGISLAFNTIGWEAQNILFGTIDALVNSEIGDADPVTAKADDCLIAIRTSAGRCRS